MRGPYSFREPKIPQPNGSDNAHSERDQKNSHDSPFTLQQEIRVAEVTSSHLEPNLRNWQGGHARVGSNSLRPIAFWTSTMISAVGITFSIQSTFSCLAESGKDAEVCFCDLSCSPSGETYLTANQTG